MRRIIILLVAVIFLAFGGVSYGSGLDDLFKQAEKIEKQIHKAEEILNLKNDKEKQENMGKNSNEENEEDMQENNDEEIDEGSDENMDEDYNEDTNDENFEGDNQEYNDENIEDGSENMEENDDSYHQDETLQRGEFNGEVIIPSSNHTWYFKMAWFNAAACSRIYYSVNGGDPRFLVEYAGIKPPANAAIPIKGLNEGDSVVFYIKTHYYRWYKMIPSTDMKHFKVKRISNYKYYYRFEDAASYDSAYNDGAFYFYMDGYGPKTRHVRILSYNLCRDTEGYKIFGKLKVFDRGNVKSRITIRDNRWRVADVINLDFYNRKSGDMHTFSFKLPYSDYTKPNYTSIWQVSFKGESDARIRMLKSCSDKCLNEGGNIFGDYTKNPFFFVGKVYRLNKGISRLPDFSKLKAVEVIYTPTLNITPRDFKAGFGGVRNMFEWFGVDYKGYFYVKRGGVYRFSLLSDDGAKLLIDDRLIIDNDGVHPPRRKYGSVYVSRGLHTIEVKYFQGPRYQVALVLSIKENGRYVPFDIRKYLPVEFESNGCQKSFTIDNSLIFSPDDYQILPDGVKLLNSIVSYLKDIRYQSVEVVESGKLANKRSRVIKSYLEGFDVKDVVSGTGEDTERLKVIVDECKN